MPSFAKSLRLGASLTASLLEITAGRLRRLASEDPEPPSPAAHEPEASAEPTAAAEPERSPEPAVPAEPEHGVRPARATRSRISNPKAARKVRSREG